jgi:hypothetical protein
MASGWFTRGLLNVHNGGIDLDTTTLKVMLVDTGYTYDPDTAAVSTISAAEITATNYTAGFGGAGRKTATITCAEQTANNRVIETIADLTWTALGGAVNDTVAAAVLIREVTNDAASIPVAYFDFSDITTNGGDVTLDFDGTDGNLRTTV